MENVRGDTFTLTCHQNAGSLIKDNQTGCVRGANLAVSIINAGPRVEVEEIAVHKDGTVRSVMRPDAGAAHHVEEPQNISVGFVRRDCWLAGGGLMFRFVLKGAVVAVRQPFRIETQNLSTVAHDENLALVYGCLGSYAALRPIQVRIFGKFGNYQLPEKGSRLFVKAHQYSAEI